MDNKLIQGYVRCSLVTVGAMMAMTAEFVELIDGRPGDWQSDWARAKNRYEIFVSCGPEVTQTDNGYLAIISETLQLCASVVEKIGAGIIQRPEEDDGMIR